MTFEFRPAVGSPPRWLGPYSPAWGTKAGFRVRNGRLKTSHVMRFGYEDWPVADCEGTRDLERYVVRHWDGGRVLILPDGKVIKPLQDDEEAGERVLIGVVRGTICLQDPDFNLSSRGSLKGGDPWLGPTTTGLDCKLDDEGSLSCTWKRLAAWGYTAHSDCLLGPNPVLAIGFRRARPGVTSGRVRVTAHGIVITNRDDGDRTPNWRFVGQIDPTTWPTKPGWIETR